MVSLGYTVDKSSEHAAEASLAKVEGATKHFAAGSMADFAKAGTAVATFVAGATIAIGKFVSETGNAAIQNEIFARQMWMNVDAAVAYRDSLKALGTNLQSLYLSPTLMKQFEALHTEAGQIGLPTGFNQAMQGAQNLNLQFARLKLEASYSVYWVGYYLTKYLAGPLGSVDDWLSKINDEIAKNMPKWTAKVAQFMAGFVDTEREAVSLFNSMGSAFKEFLAVIAGAGTAFLVLSNPVTAMLAGMTALLVLLDDYYVYTHNKNHEGSAFPGLWKALSDNKGAMGDFKTSLKDLSTAIVGADGKGGLLGAIASLVGSSGSINDWVNAVSAPLTVLAGILQGMADSIRVISGALNVSGGELSGNKSQVTKGKQQVKRGASGQSGLLNLLDFFTGQAPGTYEQWFGMKPSATNTGPKDTWSSALQSAEGWFKTMFTGAPPAWMQHTGAAPSAHVTLNATYNINGARDPQKTAQVIQKSNAGLITRALQGVIR